MTPIYFDSGNKSRWFVKLRSIPIPAPIQPQQQYSENVAYGSTLPIPASKKQSPEINKNTANIFRVVTFIFISFILSMYEKRIR
jgi:hypothetical protein